VTFTAIVVGSVDTFNQTAFKSNLAKMLTVDEKLIVLKVEAASVKVAANITGLDLGEADVVIAKLLAMPMQDLSRNLGLQVLSVEPPSMLTASKPNETGGNELPSGAVSAIIVVTVSIVIVVTLSAVTWFRHRGGWSVREAKLLHEVTMGQRQATGASGPKSVAGVRQASEKEDV